MFLIGFTIEFKLRIIYIVNIILSSVNTIVMLLSNYKTIRVEQFK